MAKIETLRIARPILTSNGKVKYHSCAKMWFLHFSLKLLELFFCYSCFYIILVP